MRRLLDQIGARLRADWRWTAYAAVIGFLMSWMVVASLTARAWAVPLGVSAAVLVGGPIFAALVQLSGLPRLLARRSAQRMLGDGRLTHAIVLAVVATAYAAVAAMVWSFALILTLGTRIGR